LITGSTSPLPGGLLAAKAGKTFVENKKVIVAKTIKFFFILQSPSITIFSKQGRKSHNDHYEMKGFSFSSSFEAIVESGSKASFDDRQYQPEPAKKKGHSAKGSDGSEPFYPRGRQ
jgi:hypothetical protein